MTGLSGESWQCSYVVAFKKTQISYACIFEFILSKTEILCLCLFVVLKYFRLVHTIHIDITTFDFVECKIVFNVKGSNKYYNLLYWKQERNYTEAENWGIYIFQIKSKDRNKNEGYNFRLKRNESQLFIIRSLVRN